jgi:hypothetical protein
VRGAFAIRISNTLQPPGRHLKHLAALAGLALSAAIALGASPTRALIVETLGNANPDASQRFTDPDEQAPAQQLTNPSTGTSGYGWSSPNLNLSITRQPSDAPAPFLDPSRNPDGRPAFGFGTNPFGTRTR